jgi:hypothetical protein
LDSLDYTSDDCLRISIVDAIQHVRGMVRELEDGI